MSHPVVLTERAARELEAAAACPVSGNSRARTRASDAN
jgi:hypothetical protein